LDPAAEGTEGITRGFWDLGGRDSRFEISDLRFEISDMKNPIIRHGHAAKKGIRS
jgi:hypothetical protein